jgi:cytochrome P450
VFYYIGLIIYRLFFHPLAKVPGPKLLAISSLPRGIRHNFFGLWYKDVLTLHAKYGRVFRIGPDEVAVDGEPGWDDVFGFRRSGKEEFMRDPEFFNSGLDKRDFQEPNIFNTDRAGHSRQRRVLAHAFSTNALREQEPIIKEYVDLFISQISEIATAGTSTDITKWFRYAASNKQSCSEFLLTPV